MNQKDSQALIAIPIVLMIAVGLAFFGSQGNVSVGGLPIFLVCVGLAFIIQWVAFVPAFISQTERFFDLTGSFTFISVIIVAVLLNPRTGFRDYLLLTLVVIWAVRLGSFLFRRIQAEGSDKRFDALKPAFFRFLLVWTLQGLWVSFSLAAALAAIASTDKPDAGIVEFIGAAIWLVGFGIEVIADRQKAQFRAIPENAGQFIDTGLWAMSRHPNYFGEIVLWVGIAIIALPALSGWQLITLISPVFVFTLITRISGVPMLEARADDKWGGQADYENYKARTPVLIPRLLKFMK